MIALKISRSMKIIKICSRTSCYAKLLANYFVMATPITPVEVAKMKITLAFPASEIKFIWRKVPEVSYLESLNSFLQQCLHPKKTF